MSEIQSIANGTYMIGETTQTEFQAGPGISITKPSEGTVRIANDETVLWENSSGNTSATTSESAYNFDFVEVYLAGSSSGFRTGANVYRLSLMNNPSYFCIECGYLYQNQSGIHPSTGAIRLSVSSTTVSVSEYYSSTSIFEAKIYKVVGVKRRPAST